MMNRLQACGMMMLLGMLALCLRLVHLQLIHGDVYRRQAEDNRLRVVPELGPRGLIYDRNGTLLAGNHTVFRVAIVPQEVENLEGVLGKLSEKTNTSLDVLKRHHRRLKRCHKNPALSDRQNGKLSFGQLLIRQHPGFLIQYPTGRPPPTNHTHRIG